MLSSLGRTAASVLGGGSATPNSGFTTDDFPALGAGGAGAPGSGSIGGPGAVGSGGIGSGSNLSAAPGSSGVPSSLGLPPGAGMGFLGSSNSLTANASGLGGVGVAGSLPPGANGAAEQASAVAALQHQHAAREQHRQNLLGAMQQQQQQQQPTQNSSDLNKNADSSGSSASGGGNNAHAALSAAKGGFGEPERNYATKLGAGNAGINAAWLTAAQQNPGGVAAAVAAAANSSSGTGAGVSSVGGLPPGIGLGSTNGINSGGASDNAALQRQRAAAIAAAQAGLPQDLANPASSAGGGANPNPTGEVASSPGQQVLFSPADRFGLVGLLSIIKMQDPDLSMLALGADLSQLGLNMSSQEPLSSSFLTPWSELADAQGNGGVNGSTAPLVEPDFHLPSCYNVQPPPPAHTKIQSFSDETLFFIFYSSPRDVLQEIAAQEL